MRAFLAILSAIICASPASAVLLKLNGPGTPNVTVYKPCETQVVVYDARPEMGVSFWDEKPEIAMLASIGVRLARVSLDLNVLEPTSRPGLYDSAYLAKWDQLVEDCRVSGVCLDVAIKGDPSLGDSNSQVSAPADRLARLVSDLAGRYPSVLYWEIGEDMNGSVSTMLKALYPAVKAANPIAQVVCIARSDALLQAIYEDGGRRCFDVACAKTHAKGFSDNAIAVRKVMAANGDESKPLWCVFEVRPDEGLLEAAFAANNSAMLYAKVLMQKAEPGASSYGGLSGMRVNGAILAKPRNIVNVLVPTKKPMIALGYDFKEVEGGIEVQRVMLDSLAPTIIQLRYAPEPPPAKPGGKPVKPKPTTDPKHIPDPWDI